VSDLRVEADGPVLRLTIDREQRRNALNDAVLRGMIAAVREPGDARVILVTGAGDKVFCAGADLSLMSEEATGLERHEARGGLRELMIAMRRCPLPVVARVQGLCLAGGVGLALGCDLVVASEAAEFGLPEVNLGLWPFMVSVLLARHCSPKLALDLMMSGRRLRRVSSPGSSPRRTSTPSSRRLPASWPPNPRLRSGSARLPLPPSRRHPMKRRWRPCRASCHSSPRQVTRPRGSRRSFRRDHRNGAGDKEGRADGRGSPR